MIYVYAYIYISVSWRLCTVINMKISSNNRTPPKNNKNPLKNGGWKTTRTFLWGFGLFSGGTVSIFSASIGMSN